MNFGSVGGAGGLIDEMSGDADKLDTYESSFNYVMPFALEKVKVISSKWFQLCLF